MTGYANMIGKAAYALFIGILLLNLAQKKYGKKGEKKRMATLFIGIAILGVYIAAGAVMHAENILGFKLNDLLIIPAVGAIAYIVYWKKEKTLPFRFKCTGCGEKLSLDRAFFIDSNLCPQCESKNASENQS